MYNNFLYLHNCIKSICVVHAGELSRCRPVTLASHRIMTMESIVLSHLHILDLLQMAYRAGVGVDEAIVYLLFHLESPGSTVKVRFSFALLFTSPVLSTSSSNHCCGRRWRRLVWTKGGGRGRCSLLSPFLCTLSSLQLQLKLLFTCRSSPMTQPLSAVYQRGTGRNPEESSRNLWTGVSRTSCFLAPTRLRSLWLIFREPCTHKRTVVNIHNSDMEIVDSLPGCSHEQ